MASRDFDAEVAERARERDPIEFTLGGVTFTGRPICPFGAVLDIAAAPARSLPNTQPGGTAQEKAEQWKEDHLLSWTANINSAGLAYILFQAPGLVGVHAAEMLPRD